MNIRLGLRVPPCAPVPELVSFARQAEAQGVDTLWLPDSQLLWRDPFVAIAAIARETDRIRLATGVTNVRTRHVTVLASLARTICEVAPARFVLGVGAGASSIRPIGLRMPTGPELEAAINRIRALCRGEPVARDRDPADTAAVSADGVVMRDPPGEVPVILAATGPKRLALAGRSADGVMLHRGTTPELVAPALAAMSAAASAAGRPPGRLEAVVTGAALFTDDIAGNADQFRPILVTMLQDGGAPVLAQAGITPGPAGEMAVELGDLKHAEDWTGAVATASTGIDSRLTRTFVDQFCLVGSAADLARRMLALEDVGVTEVMFQDLSSYRLPGDLLEGVGELRDRISELRESIKPASPTGPLTETPRLT